MKIILDTNVLISGIFFSGPPYQILKAWQEGKIQIAVSKEILAEYHRVVEELHAKTTTNRINTNIICKYLLTRNEPRACQRK